MVFASLCLISLTMFYCLYFCVKVNKQMPLILNYPFSIVILKFISLSLQAKILIYAFVGVEER